MKELQDLRNDILLLKNYGSISKEVELVLLRKLNTIEKQLMLGNVVGQSEQLKAVEKLKDFAYEVCPLHREDDLEEIVGSL